MKILLKDQFILYDRLVPASLAHRAQYSKIKKIVNNHTKTNATLEPMQKLPKLMKS